MDEYVYKTSITKVNNTKLLSCVDPSIIELIFICHRCQFFGVIVLPCQLIRKKRVESKSYFWHIEFKPLQSHHFRKTVRRALELELVFSRVSSGRHLQHHFQQHGKAYPPGRDLWWLPVFLNYLIPPFLFLVGKPMLRAWKPPSRVYTCVTQNLLLFWTDWPNLSHNVPLDSISLKF